MKDAGHRRTTSSDYLSPGPAGTVSGGKLRGTKLSRRQTLGLLAGGFATSFGLGACGRGNTADAANLAYTDPATGTIADYAGANLRAVMRKGLSNELKAVTEQEALAWSEATNATIEFDFTENWREAYTRAASDGFGPDIAELFGSAPHLLADQLVDVSSIAEEVSDHLGEWFGVARNVGMVDGVWRAIPWAYTGHAINYRADLLAEVGAPAPETFDDLLEVATRLSDAGLPQAAFSMNSAAANDSANFAYSMMWAFGGQEVDETGQHVALDSAGTRNALSFFRELAAVSDPRTATFDEFGNNQAFLDGTTALTQNASSIYSAARKSYPDIAEAMNHAQYPTGPNGHHQLVEMNALGVFRHSRNADAGMGWIRDAMQRAHLVKRTAASLAFFVPPIHGLDDDPEMPWNSDDKLGRLKRLADGAHMAGWPGPSSVEAALVYENGSIVRMFAGAGWGTESIDDLVKTAKAELVRVYET